MSLAGRNFLVTGSTDGIGKHTAKLLAGKNANVIVHGRSDQRVERTVEEVQRHTSGRVVGYVRDFSSLDEVRGLAIDVKKDFPDGISVLINNAGVFLETNASSKDGFGMTWAVNVLAPFVLTANLLDHVQHRIVNVASLSAAHSINVADDLHRLSGHPAYSCSKLCNQVFTYVLSDRLQKTGSPVTCNALDPGTVNTKMLLAGWGPMGIDLKDADYEFYAATSTDLDGVTGKYMVSNRISKSPAVSYDKSVQEKLWRMWEEQTGVVFPI